VPKVHKIGSQFFAHHMTYPTRAFPFMEIGTTQEIEWPYREGASYVFRIPLTRHAWVIGKWTGLVDENVALTHALGARWVDADELL